MGTGVHSWGTSGVGGCDPRVSAPDAQPRPLPERVSVPSLRPHQLLMTTVLMTLLRIYKYMCTRKQSSFPLISLKNHMAILELLHMSYDIKTKGEWKRPRSLSFRLMLPLTFRWSIWLLYELRIFLFQMFNFHLPGRSSH